MVLLSTIDCTLSPCPLHHDKLYPPTAKENKPLFLKFLLLRHLVTAMEKYVVPPLTTPYLHITQRPWPLRNLFSPRAALHANLSFVLSFPCPEVKLRGPRTPNGCAEWMEMGLLKPSQCPTSLSNLSLVPTYKSVMNFPVRHTLCGS